MSRDNWKRLLILAVVAAGCAVVVGRLDWTAASTILAQLGWAAPWLLVPYLGVLLCDCCGWRATFRQPGTVRVRDLLRLRVSSEALASTAPGGVAVGEAMKAVVLQREYGLDLGAAAANVVISKAAMAVAQALFLVLGLGLTSGFLREHSRELIGRGGLEHVALGAAALFLLVACGAVLLVVRGGLFARALGALSRVAPRGWRLRLARGAATAQRLDAALADVAMLPKRQLGASVAFFLAGWVALGLENWFMLRAMSVTLPPVSAVSMEAIVSLVRIAFFFIPSALGAQEVGYYFLLRAYGLPNPEVVATAFVITKRSKELIWILIGYGALFSYRLHRSSPEVIRISSHTEVTHR